jgi:uncharacterized protein with FMN-binding domain
VPIDDPSQGALPGRRRHPSRGARTAALIASVAATGSVGAAMAHADRSSGATDVAAADNVAAPAPAPSSPTFPTSPRSPTFPTSPTSPTTVPAPSAALVDGTWTGPAEFTRWGNVQVRVMVSRGQIVGVDALQIPSERRSASINGRAVPILEAEAVAEQGANLDIVSGATYTSRTYAASLQAALDAAAQGQVKAGRA